MEFIDLKTQLARIRPKINDRIQKVLDHGGFILGPEVQELEENLSKYCGANYTVSCANGTDALLMPLMALDIGFNDAIFVPSFTFFATAEVVALSGATPVFVDIDPRTYNICTASLQHAIDTLPERFPGKTPRGIIPVDLFGLSADYNAINAIAKKYNLFVIEDAAQGFGATYHGKKTGSLAAIAATSFFPAKPLGCYGDGGAIFCESEEIYKKLKSIRVHGQGKDKYHNVRLGMNGRLDTIQAAILLEKLAIFEDEVIKRNEVAARYHELLRPILETPYIPNGCVSSWAQYTIQVKNRDAFIAALKAKNIPTMIYYPIPLHLQEVFIGLGYKAGHLPVSERLANSVVSLPMHPYLTEEDQQMIVNAVKAAID